jgi:hypothetical protein
MLLSLCVVAAPLAAQQSAAVLPSVAALPARYTGNCPATIEFLGRVTVTIAGTHIDYQWERSDGHNGKVLHAVIGKARDPKAPPDTTSNPRFTQQLPSDHWRAGFPNATAQYWEVLHVLAPVDVESGHATVSMNCEE